jgi:hypothetical protein
MPRRKSLGAATADRELDPPRLNQPLEAVTQTKKKMNLLKMVKLFGNKSKDDYMDKWEDRRIPTSEMADADDNVSMYSAGSVRSSRGRRKKGWFGRRKKESKK